MISGDLWLLSGPPVADEGEAAEQSDAERLLAPPSPGGCPARALPRRRAGGGRRVVSEVEGARPEVKGATEATALKKRTVSTRLRPAAFARPRANWTTSVSNPTPISVAATIKLSTQCITEAFSQTLSRNCLQLERASSGLSFVEAVFLVLLSCFKRSYRIYIPP